MRYRQCRAASRCPEESCNLVLQLDAATDSLLRERTPTSRGATAFVLVYRPETL